MTTEDFYQLKIGQKIWVDGKEETIDYLSSACASMRISFDSFASQTIYNKIKDKCSLEPPKQKTRYWQWKIDIGNGLFRHGYYISEDGIGTSGDKIYSDWDSITKIKIEDDFADV